MKVDVDELRDVLDDLVDDGLQEATTRRIAHEMDHSTKEVGIAMLVLEKKNEVDRWSESTSPITWEILR